MNPFKNKITHAARHLALALLTSYILVSCGGSGEPASTASGIPAASIISNATLPFGIVGVPYSFMYAATGSTPITFKVTSGALPNGLSLSTSGVISGIPTLAGTYAGTITASNGTLPNALLSFSINVTLTTPTPSVK